MGHYNSTNRFYLEINKVFNRQYLDVLGALLLACCGYWFLFNGEMNTIKADA